MSSNSSAFIIFYFYVINLFLKKLKNYVKKLQFVFSKVKKIKSLYSKSICKLSNYCLCSLFLKEHLPNIY